MNRTSLAFIALGAAILASLFFYLRPAPEPLPAPAEPAPVTAAAPAVTPEPAPSLTEPAPTTVEWRIGKGQRLDGPVRVVLKQGEAVVLRITSDHDDELHLHGYDLSLALKAGQAGELQVNQWGRSINGVAINGVRHD